MWKQTYYQKIINMKNKIEIEGLQINSTDFQRKLKSLQEKINQQYALEDL